MEPLMNIAFCSVPLMWQPAVLVHVSTAYKNVYSSLTIPPCMWLFMLHPFPFFMTSYIQKWTRYILTKASDYLACESAEVFVAGQWLEWL